MRAIKMAAAALVLCGVSMPVQAQDSGLWFNSWGSCNSYLKQAQKRASASEAARWDGAYCATMTYKSFLIIFPF